MSIQTYLWSTEDSPNPGAGTSLEAYFADIKDYKFSRIFSLKCSYASAQLPRVVAAAWRGFLRIGREAPIGQLQETLRVFVSSLLTASSGLRTAQSTDVLAILVHLAHGLFMKENWVGPSYLSPNATNIMKENYKIDRVAKYQTDLLHDPIIDQFLAENSVTVADLTDFSFDKVKKEAFLKAVQLADPQNTPNVNQVLTVGGEGFNRAYKLLDLFASLKVLVSLLTDNPLIRSQWGFRLSLLSARLHRLHSTIMDSPCQALKAAIELEYSSAIQQLRDASQAPAASKSLLRELAFTKIEFGLSILPFFEYKASKTQILEVMAMWGIDIHFTGKLGVRTKYQTFKVAQLVVEVNQTGSKELGSDPEIDNASHKAAVDVNLLPSHPSSKSSLEKKSVDPGQAAAPTDAKPNIVELDQIFDNILHEEPVIDDFLGYSSGSHSLETNVTLIALLLQMMKSHAFDDQQREKAMAYLQAVISNYRDYSVMVLALTIRSNLEFAITRKMERAMLQFDQLFKDWNSKDFSLADRLRLVHTVNLPSYIELITILAQNYAKIACFMSAFGLYRDMGMHSKAIECLFLSGQKGQALDYVEGLPPAFKNQPSILCILGDIHKDPNYYQQAVKLSGGKYAPAFRALGGFYFALRDWEQSLGFYESAVALNDYHLTCWMRIAYIHMEKGRVDEAIRAYKKAVWINESEGGAWTNLALLYRRQGKPEQAFDSIQKAVALNERNWFGWYNAVIISLEHRNFSWFVKSCLKLAELDKPEEIKDFMVRKFPLILRHLMDEAGADPGLLRKADGLLSKFAKKNRKILRFVGQNQAPGQVRVGGIRQNCVLAGGNACPEAAAGGGGQGDGGRVPGGRGGLGRGKEASGRRGVPRPAQGNPLVHVQ